MNNIIKRKWNQNSMVIIEDLQGMAFQAESGGHTFQISGIDGEGNTVALSGTPAGVMLRADGQDVTLTCSVSGGVVSATLPANAYSVPGRFGLTIFLTSDGQKTAIYAAVGTVGKTSSGTVAPPAGSNVVDLVNAIAAAVATIPASYTDLMAAMAPTYSSSGLYAVGSYAWYNGKLYRCTTAITSGETWTSGHWTPANLGSDLVDLKSAINAIDQLNPSALQFENGTYFGVSVGDTLEKYDGGGYLNTRKRLATVVYDAVANVKLTAKTGYMFNIYTAVDGIITVVNNGQTSFLLEGGKEYGIVLRSTGGSDNISSVPVSNIVDVEYDQITDRTLSISGQPADAKVCGELRNNYQYKINNIRPEMTTFIDGVKATWMPIDAECALGVSVTFTENGLVKTGYGIAWVPIKYLQATKQYTYSFVSDFVTNVSETSIRLYNKAKSSYIDQQTSEGAKSQIFTASDDTMYLRIGNGSVTITNFAIVPYAHTEKYTLQGVELPGHSVKTDELSEAINKNIYTIKEILTNSPHNVLSNDFTSFSCEGIDYALSATTNKNVLFSDYIFKANHKYIVAMQTESDTNVAGSTWTLQFNRYGSGLVPAIAQSAIPGQGITLEYSQIFEPTSDERWGLRIYGNSSVDSVIHAKIKVFDVTDCYNVAYRMKLFDHVDNDQIFIGNLLSSEWYAGKVSSSLGDSLTASNVTTGYYTTLIKEKLGFRRAKNCGVGGSRMSGSASDAMWQDARINTLDINSNVVTIMAGTNDAPYATVTDEDFSVDNYDTDNFVGAYNVALSKIYYKFLKQDNGYYENIDYSEVTQVDSVADKGIIIVLMTPPYCVGDKVVYEKVKEFGEYVKRIGRMWGLPVVDTFEANMNFMNRDLWWPQNDGTHYLAVGSKQVGSVLIGKLKVIEPID